MYWILCGYSRKNTKKIKEYIANQYREDRVKDQISMFEREDPFANKRNK